MVQHQPPFGDAERGWPAADLEGFEWELGACNEPVTPPENEGPDVGLHRGDRHVADPDALPIIRHACGGPRTLPRNRLTDVPHGPVQRGEALDPIRADDRFGEERRVFVVVEPEIQVDHVVIEEMDRAEAIPVAEVARDGERGARTERPERDIRHHVQPELRDESHPRVLDAGMARAPFPSAIRLEHDALALDTGRNPVFDDYPCESDAAHVARRDHAGQQVELAVGATPGTRIQHPLRLGFIAVARTHDDSDASE